MTEYTKRVEWRGMNLEAKPPPPIRLGLYGGTFDPVHFGHLLVAQAACEELQLNRLHFILAAQSPFKPNQIPAPAASRAQCLRLALAGQQRYQVDLQEIERGGVSYTIDTVRSYREAYPNAKLFYLIGADHVSKLPQWKEATALSQLVEFIVIPRPGVMDVVVPSQFCLHPLAGFPLQLSSSQVRQRIRSGQTIRHLVPEEVREAIQNNRLYLSPESES